MADFYTEYVSKFRDAIEKHTFFCIVGHTSPDGDAVGACVALREYLESRGKKAAIVLPNAFPAFLSFLDPHGAIMIYDSCKEKASETLGAADAIVCLDFNSLSRVDEMGRIIAASTAFRMMVDHHVSPAAGDFDLLISDTHVSSTCELLYRLLAGMPDVASDASRLPGAASEALFTGMTTDTNNFSNSTYPSTFSMASALLAAGVDRTAILYRLYNQFSESRLRLIGELLKNRMTIVDGKFSYMVLTKELQRKYSYSKGDVEGVVNRPLEIGDVVLSALFTQDDDFVRVSMRSKEGTEISGFAKKYFNGGGHPNAAGGKLFMKIEEVPDYFVKTVREFGREAWVL